MICHLARVRHALAVAPALGFFVASATAALGGEPMTTPPDVTPLTSTWQFGSLGSQIGSGGFTTSKVGKAIELYTSATGNNYPYNNYWYALRYAADGSARTTFVSPPMATSIVRVTLAHRQSKAPRIVVALNSGLLNVYDQATKALLSSQYGDCGSYPGLSSFAAADLDGDGDDEFISVCGDGSLKVSSSTVAPWSVAGIGGTDIVVANLDDDPDLEIATTSGIVVDSRKHTIKWSWQGGFGAHLRAAPLGGGRTGLIGDNYNLVTAYDVSRKVPVWTIETPSQARSMEVADVDGDGNPELLLGNEGYGAEIDAYDLSTQALKGTFGNSSSATVYGMTVADVTGSGMPELIVGSQDYQTGSHLSTVTWADQTVLWSSIDLQGPFIGPALGDLDGDGKPELVFATASTSSSNTGGKLIVVDGKSLKIRAISGPVCNNAFYTGVHDIKLRDLGNGRQSILVACDEYYQGVLEAWSWDPASQFVRTWQTAVHTSSAFLSVDAADIDGDGHVEIIGGSDNSIYAYDGTTGALKWQSLRMEGNVNPSGLAIGDFDGDGHLEVAAQTDQADVYILDGATHAVEAVIQGTTSGLAVQQKNGTPQLVVGTAAGHAQAYVYTGKGYKLTTDLPVGNASVDGVLPVARGNWWVGSGGVVTHLQGGVPTAATPNYGTGFGSNVVRLASKHMIFSAGPYGVFGFPDNP